MAFSDWYEVASRGVAQGQDVVTIYHVQRNDPSIDAEIIAEAFDDTVLSQRAPLEFTGHSYTVVDVRSLDDPLDFHSRVPDNDIGLRDGANNSTIVTLSIQFNRTRTDMRNGQKRWPLGLEADNNGNLWVAGFITECLDLANAIINPWQLDSAPGVDVCDYGILKRICITSPSPPCVGGYRLPENDGELTFFIPLVAVIRSTVRSQVSRKRLV